MRPVPKFHTKTRFRIDDKEVTVVGFEWGPEANMNRCDGWLYWITGLTPDGQAKPISEAKLAKHIPLN
jgi:hypothetical protein